MADLSTILVPGQNVNMLNLLAYLKGGFFQAPAGETGVINTNYPPGHVGRYGVLPDGVTNWESSYPARIAAIFANSCLPDVVVYWPRGPYAGSLNMSGSAYNGSKMVFDDAEFYGILHIINGGSASIDDVQWMGRMASYDRLGIAAGKRIRIGDVRLLHDPTKNVSGTGNRGVHILAGEQIEFGEFVVDNTAAVAAGAPSDLNVWSAFTVQGNTRGVKGRRVWVKNSQSHGSYLNGFDVRLGELRIDGYGGSAIDFSSVSYLQDSDSEVQSQQGCGLWVNRATGRIDHLILDQANASPAADTYSVLIDETGRSTDATTRDQMFSFGRSEITVGDGNRGVCVGEALAPSVCINVDLGEADIRMRTGDTLQATYAMLNVLPPSTASDSRFNVKGRINYLNPGTNQPLKVTSASGTRVRTHIDLAGTVYGLGATAVATFNGSAAAGSLTGRSGPWHLVYAAGSFSSAPMFDLNGTGDFELHGVYAASSGGAVDNQLIRLLNTVDTRVRGVRSEGFRSSGGVMLIDGATRPSIRDVYLKGGAVTGQGIQFKNTIADLAMSHVQVADFATGFKAGTGLAFTRGSAIGVVALEGASPANTDATDLTTAQFPAVNQPACTNFAV